MAQYILVNHYLDLRGFPCPTNFVKCILVLENLCLNEVLKVDVDLGESETSLIEGLQDKGYKVTIISKDVKKASLKISCEKK